MHKHLLGVSAALILAIICRWVSRGILWMLQWCMWSWQLWTFALFWHANHVFEWLLVSANSVASTPTFETVDFATICCSVIELWKLTNIYYTRFIIGLIWFLCELNAFKFVKYQMLSTDGNHLHTNSNITASLHAQTPNYQCQSIRLGRSISAAEVAGAVRQMTAIYQVDRSF